MAPDHHAGFDLLAGSRLLKRVAHLSSVHPADDVRIFVKECCSLALSGYDVTLIARTETDCVKNGVKIIAVTQSGYGRLGRMLVSTYDVLRKAHQTRADLYHFHDPELMPVAALLRLTGAKIIYDVHEDTPRQILSKTWIPSPLRRPIAAALEVFEKMMISLAYTGVVAATPPIARRFPPDMTATVQNFPIPKELIAVGPATPMSQRQPHVVYAGGLTTVRGVCEMVSAMATVENVDARLILAGLFTEQNLERRARDLAGWNRVNHLGWLDRAEVANLLCQARAGLVVLHDIPNYIDSYPIKMFEYMSAGLPVIASDFPLWRSIIERARCGLLVDPKDPISIGNAINWILSHPEEAEAMGARGKVAVSETYNWAIEERKLLEIYKKQLD